MIGLSDFDNSRPPHNLPPSLVGFLASMGLKVASVHTYEFTPDGKLKPCNHGTDHSPGAQNVPYGTYDNSDLKKFIDNKEE